MKNRIINILLVICLCSSFLACTSKNSDVDIYKTAMDTYYTSINNAGVSINSIDVVSSNATSLLLANVDTIKTAITGINSLTPPEKYSQVNEFSEKALNDITMASSLFHEIYDTSDLSAYDSQKEADAYYYYNSAMENLKYIGQVLSSDAASTVSGSSVSSD